MNFRLELTVKPFEKRINIQQPIALVGSCFTDHIGSRLRSLKFNVLENPNGIVFNPISIERAVDAYIKDRRYTESDLFYHNELWTSWDFHGQFSHPDQQQCLDGINASVEQAHRFLLKADWVIFTLGSAFVYELKESSGGSRTGEVVANCHKVPANQFVHRLASLQEVSDSLGRTIEMLRQFNPGINIIFTISPVRHYREGLVENNRSKGALHLAVHKAIQQFESVFYFPAYELIIDDLRDYRFFAEDLVHPNYAATQYVWEKFAEACIDEESKEL
ncbi:MAG TPA: GSCFA domain-containing protein, partial [Phnomibacter sp.]|nr:GSCFA domain-containing protein [Phnomibacter sp.]